MSQILDGALVQKWNRTSRCFKLHASVSQFFGTKRTHSRVPGVKGEAFFSKLISFLCVSADRRLVQIHTNLYYEFTHALKLNSLLYRAFLCIYVEATWIHLGTWLNLGRHFWDLTRVPLTKLQYIFSLSKFNFILSFTYQIVELSEIYPKMQ